MSSESEIRAQWTSAYIDSLPDSSFLHIESGGSKDSEGKTTPRSLRHFPVKDAQGNVDLAHVRNALARIPQSNVPQAAKDAATAKAKRMLADADSMGGRSAEFRAIPEGFELRQEGDGMPTLVGNLAVFGEWTEIRSAREGHFMERMSPGAFSKTISENADRMRVLFNHGHDPSVGEKPLGPIRSLEADDSGVHYEVELLDTSYNRDLIPGLQAGLYGSSFRFEVVREDVNRKADKSAYNPKGLPERTVTEVRMSEFGPVTFPAYAGAKSGIRSLTDKFTPGGPVQDQRGEEDDAPADNAPAEETAPAKSHPVTARRDQILNDNSEEEPEWHL
jgi:HK97 family phage prohead protease